MILPEFVHNWPRFWLELFKERSAIMEHMGNLSRADADREAEMDVRKYARQFYENSAELTEDENNV